MEVKVGDLIKDRYVLKQIMLDPSKDLKEPVFIMYDKVKNYVFCYTKQEMEDILEIKEEENDNI